MMMRYGWTAFPSGLLACVIAAAGCAGGAKGGGHSIPSEPPVLPEVGPPGPELAAQKGPQPAYGPTVSAADPPPPISGGTLLVTKDGARAVASDPDRDRVYVVDLSTHVVTKTDLAAHDEPGRLAEDGAGRVHLVLRRGGAVVTVDGTTGAVLARRPVCPTPRGIAYDASGDRLLVACDGGELVALDPAPDGAATSLQRQAQGLRDVVVGANGAFWVSRFRSAEVLSFNAQGELLSTSRPSVPLAHAATLGWRMIPSPNAGAPEPLLVHEIAKEGVVSPTQGGYGTVADGPLSCGGSIVDAAVTQGAHAPLLFPQHVVLPVDMAADKAGFAVVAAGNGHTPKLPQIFYIAADATTLGAVCDGPQLPTPAVETLSPPGQAIAVALTATALVVQSREPASLVVYERAGGFSNGPTTIALASETREDTGHAVFHSNSGSGVACASCHGEGGDDGHVWQFAGLGARRTPSLRGTIAGTAPYHWGGDMKDITMLAQAVLSSRMNGPSLDAGQVDALQTWLFAIPAPAPASGVDAASAARGKGLFEGSAGCVACHAGPMLTNSQTVDVGTGGSFQVPSLVGVSARAPFLHDGCAATLADRFGACATEGHGRTSQLAPADVADLVSYLQTL